MNGLYKQKLERLIQISRKSFFIKKLLRRLFQLKVMLSRFESDESFAKKMYKNYTGDALNLANPQTFNDKLWWLKYHYHNPLQTICSDKYRVREYVKQCGLDNILVPLKGVYYNAKDIPFEQIDSEVFLKVNSGSGGNIIFDPHKPFDKKQFIWDFNSKLKQNAYFFSREWNYKDVTPCIVCEEVLRDANGNLPKDYKFMCFHGSAKLLFYSVGVCDANGMHNVTGERYTNVYDMDFNYIPLIADQPTSPDTKVEKPKNFETMRKYAEILSKPFPHCRVDFYSMNNNVYFGEITFYHGGGCRKIEPMSWSLKLGEWIDLSKIEDQYRV